MVRITTIEYICPGASWLISLILPPWIFVLYTRQQHDEIKILVGVANARLDLLLVRNAAVCFTPEASSYIYIF